MRFQSEIVVFKFLLGSIDGAGRIAACFQLICESHSISKHLRF